MCQGFLSPRLLLCVGKQIKSRSHRSTVAAHVWQRLCTQGLAWRRGNIIFSMWPRNPSTGAQGLTEDPPPIGPEPRGSSSAIGQGTWFAFHLILPVLNSGQWLRVPRASVRSEPPKVLGMIGQDPEQMIPARCRWGNKPEPQQDTEEEPAQARSLLET